MRSAMVYATRTAVVDARAMAEGPTVSACTAPATLAVAEVSDVVVKRSESFGADGSAVAIG